MLAVVASKLKEPVTVAVFPLKLIEPAPPQKMSAAKACVESKIPATSIIHTIL